MKKPNVATQKLRVGDLVIDTGTHRVTRGSDNIKLTKRSFEFFLELVRAAPNIVTSEELLESVWSDRVVGHETVTQRVKLLRDALGDNSHAPRYIEVAWGEGYRLCADVEILPAQSAAPSMQHRLMPHWQFAATFTAAVFLALGVMQFGPDIVGDTSAGFSPPPSSIAVMPFLEMGNDTDDDFLALGIPDTVLHRLANLENVLVIARTSSFTINETGNDAHSIGRELNVRYLLEGSVQQSAGQVRIIAQLIDTTNSSHVWSLERRLAIEDIFDVQDEIVLEIVSALELTLKDSERRRLLANGTASVPAYLAYLRGQYAFNSESVQQVPVALDHYMKAAELDPKFARAWIGIAKTYLRNGQLGSISKFEMKEGIETYIARALSIDDSLGEAYAIKAMALSNSPSVGGDSNLAGLRNDLLEEALRRSPNDPVVLLAYATSICDQWEKDRSCHEKKAAVLREAIQRDPENPGAYIDLGWTLVAMDRRDGPGTLFRESIRRNPDYIPGYMNLALWHWGSSNIDWARSVVCLCEALERDPGNPLPASMLARIHVDLGLSYAAEDFVARVGEPGEALQPMVDYDWLKLHLYRGEVEKAANYARKNLPQIADGSMGIMALGAILESALASGEYEADIALLEETFTAYNVPVEYKDGFVHSRNAAFAAVQLSELHRAANNTERAEVLVEGAKTYFEREIANESVWRASNAWAYAATLANSGQTMAALSELETIPTNYLRNSWYISRTPIFDSLREDDRFENITAEIRRKIAAERSDINALDDDLPPCIDESENRLPGLLALLIPRGHSDRRHVMPNELILGEANHSLFDVMR